MPALKKDHARRAARRGRAGREPQAGGEAGARAGPDEVLIKVELAGLIFGDVEARRGTYFTETRTPGSRAGKRPVTSPRWAATSAALTPATACGAGALARLLCGVRHRLHQAADPAGNYQVPPADIIQLPDSVSFAQALVYLVNFRLAHLLFHGSSQVPRGTTIVVQGRSRWHGLDDHAARARARLPGDRHLCAAPRKRAICLGSERLTS